MKLHSLCEIFPKIDGKEFDELVADIKKNGLREPIIVIGDEILDGQNRFAACKEAGVHPTFEEFKGDDDEAEAFVVSKNLSRRHLSLSQLSMIGAGLATRRQGFQKEDARVHIPPTVKEASEITKASVRNINKARKIKAASPKLAEQVRDGDVTINAAEKVAKLPKRTRDRAVEKGPEAVAEAASKTRKVKPKSDAAREKEIEELQARIDKLGRGHFLRVKLEAEMAKLKANSNGDDEIEMVDQVINWLSINRKSLFGKTGFEIAERIKKIFV